MVELKNKKTTIAALFFSVIILLSCLIIYQATSIEVKNNQVLGLSVSPNDSTFKLGVNESKTFTASALNGTEPYTFSWEINPSANITLKINNETLQLEDKLMVEGESLTLCYPEATEDFVTITLSGTDKDGLTGQAAPFIVADPYTSPGYYFDASTATVSHIVETDELGWYRVINGLTGAVTYSGTDAIATIQTAINSAEPVKGTVFIRNGNYTADVNKDLYLRSNVKLIGESREGVIIQSTGHIIVRFNGVSNSAIESFTISHAGGTNIMTVYIYGSSPENITIDNVHFSGKATWCINVAATDYLTVKNCVADSSNLASFLYASSCLNNSKVNYNTLKDISGIGIYARRANNCEFNYNTLIDAINSNFGGAITIGNYGGNSVCNDICFNKIVFTKNPTALGVSGILVSGELSSSYYTQITLVEGNSMLVESVTGNLTSFIYSHGSSGVAHTVCDLTVSNNRVSGADSAPTRGLTITYTDYFIVTINTCDKTQTNGILVSDSDYGIVKNNIVRNFDLASESNPAILLDATPVNVTKSDNIGDDI